MGSEQLQARNCHHNGSADRRKPNINWNLRDTDLLNIVARRRSLDMQSALASVKEVPAYYFSAARGGVRSHMHHNYSWGC